jgi:hypothetical protein
MGPTGGFAVVLDDHSRYALALENTGSTQARGVQAVLERVFRESGVPEEMLMDQDVSLRFSGTSIRRPRAK